MAKRIESPSSINTFKQCPRKYFYLYLKNFPTLPNIHQIRGNIAHSTLESFYDLTLDGFTSENYPQMFRESIQKLLLYHWNLARSELKKLSLNKDQERFYFEETMLMLMNWVGQFIDELSGMMKLKNCSLHEAFQKLTPLRETEYCSEHYSVKGVIDAIHDRDGEIHVIDYKTNSAFEVKDSLRLQLAIYSLLYQEKHGKAPSKVGIFFLRHKLKLMTVDQELLDLAKKEITLIHQHTSQKEEIADYPQKIGPLCKWGSGQCDFYNVCQPKLNGNQN